MNIYDLHKKRLQREKDRLKHYKNILKKCHKRIKLVSDKMMTCCIYVIPEFVFGIPLYNTTECATYVVEALRQDGFAVTYHHPNLLYISWKVIPKQQFPEYKKHKQIQSSSDVNFVPLVEETTIPSFKIIA